MKVILLKVYLQFRTDNPCLAVKILNGTPRQILRERKRETEREKENGLKEKNTTFAGKIDGILRV